MRAIYNALFRRISVKRELEDLRYEAERKRIEYQLSADYNQALADMYSRRIAWIDDQLSAGAPPVPLRAAA
jgi:hypothetical protein